MLTHKSNVTVHCINMSATVQRFASLVNIIINNDVIAELYQILKFYPKTGLAHVRINSHISVLVEHVKPSVLLYTSSAIPDLLSFKSKTMFLSYFLKA